MTKEEILWRLDQESENVQYRELYECRPDAFERPIQTWEEFCSRFSEEEREGSIRTPSEAPTPIAGFLTEKEFFQKNADVDVSIIVNARCCPAFLHKLEFIKVIYVYKGNCSFFYKGKWFAMTEGNVCIVSPGIEQTVFSCGKEDIVMNLLLRRTTFTEAFAELLETESGGAITDFFWKMLMGRPGGEVMLFAGKPQQILEETILELYEEAVLQPVKSRLIIRGIMLSVFACILRWDEQDAVKLNEGRKAERPYPLPEYLEYMKQNMNAVSLASMAGAFFVSEGYLSRYIKKETGETFSHLLQKMRMKKAAELLINTECNIEKIIELIGYTDQSVFFRNFRRMYGMTPVTYRKKKRRINIFGI